MTTRDERPASLDDMRLAWPDKTDDELRAAADAIAAAGGTLTVVAVPDVPDHHEQTPSAPAPGQFCHEHFSWLCQAGQGECQRTAEQDAGSSDTGE